MPTLQTPFCTLTNVSVPVVQAPIGGQSNPVLAAAVSEAGGLGMLAASWTRPAQLRTAIRDTQARTTKPFGVNLILEWDQRERVETCLDAGVRIISTFWGSPAALVDTVHQADAIHVHTVGTAAEAKRVVDDGVDVVVAQGWEAGGHVWGEVSSMALVPSVVDAVSPVPVVAAGGIADGRGLAAVLALGADAAWVGTRFLLAQEAGTAEEYRKRLIDACEADTVHGTVFDLGWPDAPHRALRNSTVRAWEMAGRPGKDGRPGESELIGTFADGRPILRYSDTSPESTMAGDIEAMALYAGQGVGLLHSVQSASEIVAELCAGAAAAFTRFQGGTRSG